MLWPVHIIYLGSLHWTQTWGSHLNQNLTSSWSTISWANLCFGCHWFSNRINSPFKFHELYDTRHIEQDHTLVNQAYRRVRWREIEPCVGILQWLRIHWVQIWTYRRYQMWRCRSIRCLVYHNKVWDYRLLSKALRSDNDSAAFCTIIAVMLFNEQSV